MAIETERRLEDRLIYDCAIAEYTNLGEEFEAMRAALACEHGHNGEIRAGYGPRE